MGGGQVMTRPALQKLGDTRMRPIHGLEAVARFQYKIIISLKYFKVNKSKAWNVANDTNWPHGLVFPFANQPQGLYTWGNWPPLY